MTHPKKLKTPQEALAHYGVKGMKWGVRKKGPTTTDILGARDRVSDTSKRLKTLEKAGKATKDQKTKEALVKEIRDVAKQAKASGDTKLGSQMTKGERVASVVLDGNWGMGIVKLQLWADRFEAEDLFNRLGKVTVKDLGG